MKAVSMCIAGLLCLLPLTGIAQWQWIDQAGNQVFSDRGPSSDIPDKNILRRPGTSPSRSIPSESMSAASSVEAMAPGASPARVQASAARPSGVDKALEQKARKAEESEKAARAVEEQKVMQTKSDNCARARQGKATFDSGVRVARINANGEREIMDDKARATEQLRVQSVIDSNCG